VTILANIVKVLDAAFHAFWLHRLWSLLPAPELEETHARKTDFGMQGSRIVSDVRRFRDKDEVQEYVQSIHGFEN
jgi:hypothetical protein